jgi:hypothetical protein
VLPQASLCQKGAALRTAPFLLSGPFVFFIVRLQRTQDAPTIGAATMADLKQKYDAPTVAGMRQALNEVVTDRAFASCISSRSLFIDHPVSLRVILNLRPLRLQSHFRSAHLVTGDQPFGRMFDVTFWRSPYELEKPSLEHQWRNFSNRTRYRSDAPFARQRDNGDCRALRR